MEEGLKVNFVRDDESEDSWTWELCDPNGDKVAEGNYMGLKSDVEEDFKKFERRFKNTGLFQV